jgi:NAD-dependent SIR2 family protein deacetylase
LQQINALKAALDSAEAVFIGAGAGLSTAAGLVYDGPHFTDNFADMIERYGKNNFTDMYSAGFYPFKTPEEKWAYWSRFIDINRYQPPALKTHLDLYALVKDKDYFVLTTNVDHQFQKAGFSKSRLFYTQGDYGLFQCAGSKYGPSQPSPDCRRKTYDNEAAIRAMVAEQRDGKIPSSLLPTCPICGGPMAMNLRADDTFIQDEGWNQAAARYEDFVNAHRNTKTLYLELGVGYNTPGIIKYNFWNQTQRNPRALYACINTAEIELPKELEKQSLCIQGDISAALEDLKKCR